MGNLQSESRLAPVADPAAAGAYALLTFTMIVWGGNAVASKLALGQVSPLLLTSLRWLIATAVLLPLARRQIARDWGRLRPSWRRLLLAGLCGCTGFGALAYTAAFYTTATNIALIQGVIPVMVFLLSFVLYRTPIGRGQAAGLFVVRGGVATVATHGNVRALYTFSLNRGDAFMLVASLFYAVFIVALRGRPAVPALAFFTAMAVIASLASLPLVAAEWAHGQLIWPTPRGWAIALFMGLGTSVVSQLTFIKGVELIGPNRAGVFINLLPVFGALMAVLLLGEPFEAYDAVALALVGGGILIAERLGTRPRRGASPKR